MTQSFGSTLVYGFGNVFAEEAKASATRSRTAAGQGRREESAGAAAATVLMACAALEATISELATILNSLPRHPDALSEDDLHTIRDGNKNLATRYMKLIKIYSPKTECDDHEEFKNVRCLVELRNHFAHRHAAFLDPGQWPKELRKCRARIPYHADGHHDWTSVLLIPDVADWALKTQAAFMSWFGPLIPDVKPAPSTGDSAV